MLGCTTSGSVSNVHSVSRVRSSNEAPAAPSADAAGLASGRSRARGSGVVRVSVLVTAERKYDDILPALKAPKILEGFDTAGQPCLRPAHNAITVRHLLTHTSGYTYSIWSENLTRYEKVTGMPDIGYSLNGAFSAPLEFEPGERWQYGIGMDWIGKIVEAVTDQSLEVYFREHIFQPLGMTDTGFLIGSAQKERVATLYKRQSDGALMPVPFEINQRPEFFMGGGGLFSTPRDYMVFLQMLLNKGRHRNTSILRPQTVATMLSNQIGDLRVVGMRTAQPEWSNSFDLLFRGQEIITGGQRLHEYADYLTALTDRGLDAEPFAGYLEAFRHGMPPHGGFALGVERLIALLTGAANVRDVTLFPRDMQRLTP